MLFWGLSGNAACLVTGLSVRHLADRVPLNESLCLGLCDSVDTLLFCAFSSVG